MAEVGSRDVALEGSSILSKAFELLRAFDTTNRVMTLSELARASGLPKSTVHRLLGRLVELEVVERHAAGRYRIGLGLMQIGSVSPALSMRDAAMPYLTSLQQWTGHAVYFGVLRGLDVVCLQKLEPPNFPGSPWAVGSRLAATCSAIGKALLAYEDFDGLMSLLPERLPTPTARSITSADFLIKELRQVRRLGLAEEHEETRVGLACLAAPIVARGFAVGALSVAHPASVRLDPKTHAAMSEAAAGISKDVQRALAEGRSHWFPRHVP